MQNGNKCIFVKPEILNFLKRITNYLKNYNKTVEN